MNKKIVSSIIALLLAVSSVLKAQYNGQDTGSHRFFAGSSMFMLGNLAPKNKPDFVQLNFGYRISGSDAISLELKTWKYGWPLGIPFGPSFEAPDEKFPGYIREHGFALAYQHFWWKGLYSAIHIMNAWQKFVDESGTRTDNGFQLFNTYRLGYHFSFSDHRFFIEPSLAVTHRPFHTEMPESFKQVDDNWPKFFYGEPGLHFGVNF